MGEAPSPSKTQQKQQADSLQKLGIKISELHDADRQKLQLPPRLEQAIDEYRAIRSHGAKRRQSQLIGKLMRAANHEKIAEDYAQILAEHQGQTATFHRAEQWREQLIGEPESLTQFISQYAPDDIQQLRQLVKKAQADRQRDKNTGAAKALFRMIKDVIA